jgi:hypothetical protein
VGRGAAAPGLHIDIIMYDVLVNNGIYNAKEIKRKFDPSCNVNAYGGVEV